MRLLLRLIVALREWLRFGRLDHDFGEELRFHLERQTQANLEAGMSPDKAIRAARQTLGGVQGIKEASRDHRHGALARQLVRDLVYGVRLMRKAPGFAAASVAVVALGIGAVTAIFSVVYGVMLRPLPYHEPDRLATLSTQVPDSTLGPVGLNAADARDVRADNHAFEDIALVRRVANFNLIGDGEPERLFAARVSSNLFSVLGVIPAVGRTFTEDEDEIGRDRVVLLSHALWQRRFGGAPSIVGRTINLSGVPHTVVGVMRADFQFPSREYQILTPLTINPAELSRTTRSYDLFGLARLKPALSVQQAQSEMHIVAKRLEASYPATNRGVGFRVVPMMEDSVRDVRPALYVLMAAVSCLLLIACLNLANLLAARAATRTREFAVRLALGASRGRLTWQALAEVAPILGIGGTLGVLAAAWCVAAFAPFAPAELPRMESIEVDGAVLALSAGLLVLTGFMAGLVPAAQAWRSDPRSATQDHSRSTTGGRQQARTRSLLVVVQVALVLPLLAGAGLLVRSFSALIQVDPGFRGDNVLSLHLAIPRSKYRNDAEVAAFCARVVERIAALPGVASAGMVNRLPLAGGIQILGLEFENANTAERPYQVDSRTVTPDYFRTMGIPLIQGRLFTNHDTTTAAVTGQPRDFRLPTAGIIDERLAQAVWPGLTALGRRFRLAIPGAAWIEIVGVVGHIRHDSLAVDSRPQVYFNYLQRAQDRMVLVVRGPEDVRALTPAIVRTIRAVDPEQPVYDVRTLSEVRARSTASRWLNMTIVAAFATIALVLAGIGVYGVVAYGVTQRMREFGIRLALGAARSDVTRLVLRRGAWLAAFGSGIGLAVALVLTRGMETLLYGVKPGDAVSFLAAVVVLLAVVLLASYVPARRAAAVDPATTLRAQ